MNVVYGYAKRYYYDERSRIRVQVRIPSIHGAYNQKEYKGQQIRNYTKDEDLPFYDSLVLPRVPNEGDVVALMSLNDGRGSDFMVIGLTGAKYNDGSVDLSSTGKKK